MQFVGILRDAPLGPVPDFRIGQTAPLTGPDGEYGRRLSAGLLLAFKEANAAGGVKARNVTLLTFDDAYNVAKVLPSRWRMPA